MKHLKVSEDFVPVSEFKAQASEWLRKVSETDSAVVVTQNGKPAGVLISPKAFDVLTEEARFRAAVQEGLADADAGRVLSHEEVVARMKSRYARRKK